MFSKSQKSVVPLPFPFYFWPVVFLGLAGVADSIYLTISHYKVYTDMAYKSFCAISQAINCDTVSQSPYSVFLGLPVAVWGIIGYVFFLLFMPIARSGDAQRDRIWPSLFFLSLCFCIYSVILALLSTHKIHSYCIMCIVSYAINFMLLFYVWIIRRRFGKSGVTYGLKQDFLFLWKKRVKASSIFIPFFVGVSLTYFFIPHYWQFEPPSLKAAIPKGITEDGHPWIGAENPELTITEFTDYQCFQCKKMHFYLRSLIASHPDKIRLVHRHFPMDHKFNPTIVPEPFHEGSGEMALLAIYAARKGKFWEMNDLLFELGTKGKDIGIRLIAKKTALDFKELSSSRYNRKARRWLLADIWKGMKLRVLGTPGYLINGEVYQGYIPPEIIKNVIRK
jgi:uncharacterized membrane protein/protein-disulfide isomerase